MNQQEKETLRNRGMIEIAPGMWTTSARTPAEDSADWSGYKLDDDEFARLKSKYQAELREHENKRR